MRKQTSPSIRKNLLIWLAPPLAVIWLVSTLLSLQMINDYADQVFDHELLDSADSVVARIDYTNGRINVNLTPKVRAILAHNSKDKFYYQVLSPSGKYIVGDKELPSPPASDLASFDKVSFRTITLSGEQFRICLCPANETDIVQPVPWVQIGETLHARQQLMQHIVTSMVVPDLLLMICATLALWFGVTRGLAPLLSLADAVASRSRYDLSPLPEKRSLLEVRPLVKSINDLIERLRNDIEAQERFISNAAHQLKTPLSGFKTYVGLLRRLNPSRQALEIINQLDAGADTATRLVNKLLSLAKADPMTNAVSSREILDLNSVASAVTATFASQSASKNIDLSFKPSAVSPLIRADKEGLDDLISNIIENAIHFTQSGGAVDVRVVKNNQISLIVEDNGPGIAQEERERVFERFYRVLGTGVAGSGIGLAIVHEIATAHNASVILDTGADGHGTKVVVEFPNPD